MGLVQFIPTQFLYIVQISILIQPFQAYRKIRHIITMLQLSGKVIQIKQQVQMEHLQQIRLHYHTLRYQVYLILQIALQLFIGKQILIRLAHYILEQTL